MLRTATGMVCTGTYALLYVKFFTKRLRLQKADRAVMKMHEAVSGTFFLSMLIHAACNIVSVQRGMKAAYWLGSSAAISSIVLIALCHMMKDPEEKYKWHLILASGTLALIAGHEFAV